MEDGAAGSTLGIAPLIKGTVEREGERKNESVQKLHVVVGLVQEILLAMTSVTNAVQVLKT